MHRNKNLLLGILKIILDSEDAICSVSEKNFQNVSSDEFIFHINMLIQDDLIKLHGYQPGYLVSLTTWGYDYLEENGIS